MDVLIYADTLRSPELRHEIPAGIGDPFLYAERDGRPEHRPRAQPSHDLPSRSRAEDDAVPRRGRDEVGRGRANGVRARNRSEQNEETQTPTHRASELHIFSCSFEWLRLRYRRSDRAR